VEHHYNDEFLVAEQSVDGDAVNFDYDHDGLLTGAGALTISRVDSAGRVSGTSAGSVTSDQGYNAWGELDSLRYDYSGAKLFSQKLTRDERGRIKAVAEYAFGTSRTLGYRYDDAGRLYAVTTNGDTTAKYLYDANGNRRTFENPQTGDTASANYDDQDRMLRYKNTAYAYTAAGDLQTKATGGNTTAYAYDALGNLNRVQFPAGDTLTYAVDGANRRVGRRASGAWSGGWLYQNALQVVAELDTAGAVKNRYVWGAEGHVPALLLRGGGTYRLVTDYLGSVRGVVNTSTGAVMQRRDYDAWGVAVKDSNAAFQALGYAGGLTDTATGLVRFGARDYDPATGRWTAKDPSGIASLDCNYFRYASDNPIDQIDPAGDKTYVIYYQTPIPHVGIGFNAPVTHGYRPAAGPLPIAQGEVSADLAEPVQIVVLDTTPAEEKAMLAKIRERQANPGIYNVASRNCAHFVEDVLAAGGIPTERTAFPPNLMKQLRRDTTSACPRK